KSTTATFLPFCASAAPIAAVVVVLPTPPLPDVTTSTLAILIILLRLKSVERRNPQRFAFKPRLRWSVAKSGVELFRGPVKAVDGEQLGLDLLAIDARGRIAVDTGHGAATQRAVDVNGAAGDDLGAGRNRSHDSDVAVGKDDRLAGAHGGVEQKRGRRRGL